MCLCVFVIDVCVLLLVCACCLAVCVDRSFWVFVCVLLGARLCYVLCFVVCECLLLFVCCCCSVAIVACMLTGAC